MTARSPTIAQINCASLAMAVCLCAPPALAGNQDDARLMIERLLTFDRPDHPEVQSATATFAGCAFTLTATFTESGAPMHATLWGDASDVSPDEISRQPGSDVEVLQFRMYERPIAWGASFEVGPQHPLFQELTADPNAVDFLSGDCSPTACLGTLLLPGDWDHYDFTFGLTGLVNDTEADQVLAAFQNLADLCIAQAQ